MIGRLRRRATDRSRILLAAALLSGLGVGMGHAAGLNLGTQSLGAGGAAVGRCGAGAPSVIETIASGLVTTITVTGMPAACGGASLQVTLHNGTTSSSASGTVPAGGGSVAVNLATAIAPGTAGRVDVIVVGP